MTTDLMRHFFGFTNPCVVSYDNIFIHCILKRVELEENIVIFEVFTAVVMKSTETQRTTQRHIPEDDTLQERIVFLVTFTRDRHINAPK
jgi:hypothetical protein